MKHVVVMLAAAFLVGTVVGVIGNQVLNAQPQPVKSTDLLKSDVVGMEGTEVVVQLVEFAPRASTGQHVHPGHEVAYVLEGSGISEAEGMAPVSRAGGTVTYIPANKVHESKNGSATDPLKLLVFRIHPKGQPIVTNRVTEPHIMH